MQKQYVTAKEVAELLGISMGKSYAIIRELNAQLNAAGYITISGKVSKAFFIEKCCYGGMETE